MIIFAHFCRLVKSFFDFSEIFHYHYRPMEKEYLSKRELQEYLRISRGTVDKLMKQDLPFFKVGAKVLFRRRDVDKWIEGWAVPRKK